MSQLNSINVILLVSIGTVDDQRVLNQYIVEKSTMVVADMVESKGNYCLPLETDINNKNTFVFRTSKSNKHIQ